MFLPRRLDKYLRESTPLSAVQARQALEAGRVRVVDAAARDGSTAPGRIIYEGDGVELDGRRVEPRQVHHYAVLNKPQGVTSTTRDPGGERDLSEYLRQMPEGMFPVGRLDRETTGLLLFTTEGDLATAVLQPEHATEKVYWLRLDAVVGDDDPRLAALVDGVPLPGGLAQASFVRVHTRSASHTELLLGLRTGMNRQIRRMCYAVGLRLLHLHRRSVGSVSDAELAVGAWRGLTSVEVDALWDAAGGRELVTQRRIAALRREAERARAAGTPNSRLEEWLAAPGR